MYTRNRFVKTIANRLAEAGRRLGAAQVSTGSADASGTERQR